MFFNFERSGRFPLRLFAPKFRTPKILYINVSLALGCVWSRAHCFTYAAVQARQSQSEVIQLKCFVAQDASSRLFIPPSSVGIGPVKPFLSKLKETAKRM
jgi:hypothetical protein